MTTLSSLLAPFGALRLEALAYALVSAYDGDIADAERARFVDVVGDRIPGPRDTLAAAFEALAGALRDRLDAFEPEAIEMLEAAREDDALADRVLAAARRAVVADEILAAREEVAVARIAHAIGRDPNEA